MRSFMTLLSLAAIMATSAMAKEVNVGIILPMSGALAGYGQVAYEGVELANALQPKLKNGDTIKLVLVDTKGDKVESANAATRLITSDKVVGIVGEMISTNTAQIISIIKNRSL